MQKLMKSLLLTRNSTAFIARHSLFTTRLGFNCSTTQKPSEPSILVEQHPHVEVFFSDSNDIYFNLALEQYLYTQDLRVPRLMLWKNNPAVIIGKYQNQWQECNMVAISEDNVPIVRRKSGGGTVYHDLGNICFSFMTPIYSKDIYPLDPRQYNVRILQNAMASLGITTGLTQRKDLTLLAKKISGSAYQANMADKNGANKKCLHHGTLLLHADLIRLWRYLEPRQKKSIESRAQESVVSKVCNIQDIHATITEQAVYEAIATSFQKFFSVTTVHKQTFKFAEMQHNPFIKTEMEEMSSWQWMAGQTPKFQNKISIALIDGNGNLAIKLTHDKGYVDQIEFEFDDNSLFYYSQIALNDMVVGRDPLRYGINEICTRIREVLDNQSVSEFERSIILDSLLPALPDLL